MKLWIDKNPKKCILLISTLIFISIFGFFFLKSSKQIYICLTSLSFLHGRLDLPYSPLAIPADLQFHSGKIFTNWGFAIPILQLPFQLISKLFDRSIFFPEVFIFYFYYFFCTIFIFNYIKSLIKNIKTSIILSCFIVAILTLWLVSYRFEVYEQTAAYYMLGLICLFVSYKKILGGRQNIKNYMFHVVISSLLILTRPLAIIPIFLVNIHLLTKNRRLFLFSILSLVIPISFFALSNYIKTGSFFADGLINTNPGNIHQLFSNRIGDACLFSSFDLFVAKIKIFFHVIFYGNSSAYPCFLTFEDSISLQKPYLSHFLNLLAFFSIIFLIFKHKYAEVIFFLAGLILTFFIYVFFSFYFTYRYVVDFLFFYFLIFFEVLLLSYKKRYEKIYFSKVNLLLTFSFLFYFVKIIYPQLPSITAVVNTENYSLINFADKKVDYFPLYRSCGDKKLISADLVFWDQPDCKVKDYLNTYLSFSKNEKNKYRLNIEGKNLPAILTLIINGTRYNNIDWRHFEFEMRKIRGNNVNVFIYFGDDSRDVVITKIYFN